MARKPKVETPKGGQGDQRGSAPALDAGGSGNRPTGPDAPNVQGPTGDLPIRLLPFPQRLQAVGVTAGASLAPQALKAYLARLIHSPPVLARGSGLGAWGSRQLPGAQNPEPGASKVLKQFRTTLQSALRSFATFIVQLAMVLAPVLAGLALGFGLSTLPGRGRGFGAGRTDGSSESGSGRGGEASLSPPGWIPWMSGRSRRPSRGVSLMITRARTWIERAVSEVRSERWEPWWSRAPPRP